MNRAGGLGELVGELLGALARDARLAGGRLERLDRGAADGVGAARLARVVLLGHLAREPIRLAVSSRRRGDDAVHVHPTAPLAERALLPGDPGRALALAQALCEAPAKMFNHNRGLWGYTGTALDGAPLTVQSTGLGGPSAAIVRRGAVRPRAAARRSASGTCRALDGGAALGEIVAVTGALPPTARAARSARASRSRGDGALTAALARARGPRRARSSRPTSSTTRARASAPSGRPPARSRSISRRPRCSRSRGGAASAPARALAVTAPRRRAPRRRRDRRRRAAPRARGAPGARA